MASPPGNHQEQSHTSVYTRRTTHSNGSSVVENPGSYLKHNPGISLDWTAEEHAILEDGLRQYASETNIIRYAKIAMQLQNKTVRDVALRCRWMTKKENSKRRKDDFNVARKTRDRREGVGNGSIKSGAATSNGLPVAPPGITDYNDHNSYKAIGGVLGEMLEQNAQVLNQLYANIGAFQLQDNVRLLAQMRDNLFRILSSMNDMPGTRAQMPPLPTKMNERLANAVFHPTNRRPHS